MRQTLNNCGTAISNPASALIGQHETLVDIARHHAKTLSEKTFFRWLENGKVETNSYTFGELDKLARALAVKLHKASTAKLSKKHSDIRALIVTQPGPQFIPAFFACQYAGIVAIPAHPLKKNESSERLCRLIEDSDASILICDRNTQQAIEEKKDIVSQIEMVTVEDIDLSLARQWKFPDISADTIAFIQYTSGSTGTPKGVVVTHHNLISNERIIAEAMNHDEETKFVGWLPLFHDMGLIGNLLQPFCLGVQSIMMSPQTFIAHPIRWLEAISRYRGTTSGGPNFAYDLCVFRTNEEQRRNLDLSSWKVAFNGAEPIRADTLLRFAQKFAKQGFKKEALYPCYGMAESTLFISGAPYNKPPTIVSLSKKRLGSDKVFLVDTNTHPETDILQLASSGVCYQDCEVRIVDPKTEEAFGDNQVGEIWVRSPSNASHYQNQPELSQKIFEANINGDLPQTNFLRTGDLGFTYRGELFVTGRNKDLIIISGRNHYPQDIEFHITNSLQQVLCRAAAFSVEANNEENLVVVLSLNRRDIANLSIEEVNTGIKRTIAKEHGIAVHDIVITSSRLPFTSSGKIQRSQCKKIYLNGGFEIVTSRVKPTLRDTHSPQPELA